MDSINYVSHKFSNNIDDVKGLALYFDHIKIIDQSFLHVLENQKGNLRTEIDKNGIEKIYKKHKVVATNDFTSVLFKMHLQPLADAGLISYYSDPGENVGLPFQFRSKLVLPTIPVSNSELFYGDGYKLPINKTNEIMFINNDIIDHSIKTTISNQKFFDEISFIKNELERKEYLLNFDLVHRNKNRIGTSNTLEGLDPIYRNEFTDIQIYIGKLFQSLIDFYNSGENTITTSKYLNELLKYTSVQKQIDETKLLFKNELDVHPYIVNEAIKIYIPNLSKFPTEEILRFRELMKDELQAFKSKMMEMTFDLQANYSEDYIRTNAQKIVGIKINPLVEDLRRKIKSNNFSVLDTLIEEAKDPKSYSPLLLTLSENISSSLILLVSLGFISAKTALEFYSKNKEVKKDGVFYLYELSNKFG